MSYNKNVPEVPVLNIKRIIKDINKHVMQLSESETESISLILEYNGCEPSNAADLISDLLDCNYYAIFNLL